MTPPERLEDVIRSVRVTTRAETDERIMSAGDAALAKRNEQYSAGVYTSGPTRRTLMKRNWIKLATAAAIIAAMGLGMYVLTGSVDVASITVAQVKQAMEGIDWMQIINKSRIEEGEEVDWYSFVSKVEIKADTKGRISYADFKVSKQLFWPGKGEYIYESPIETQEFAQGASGPFQMIEKGLKAGFGENVVKELGTYQGRKAEVWTANQVKRGSTEALILYIDTNKKLPIAAAFKRQETETVNPEENFIEFRYPQTGPADIYEAGAPRSAQIKPATQQ